MMYASPLRYPGGKAPLADVVARIRKLNGLSDTEIAEPFAGGAGASLTLLFQEETPRVRINDADPAIHDFWWAATAQSGKVLDWLAGVPVTVDEWRRQRQIYHSPNASRLKRGVATFYLNRCNRSGIILDGSVIGGLEQTGRWGIDARFNREALRKRLERVAEYSERIAVSGDDALDFLQGLDPNRTFCFIDPPYYHKGPTLYLNAIDSNYHAALAERLRALAGPWILTYDECPEIRGLYEWAHVREFQLSYSAAERRRGREVMITPHWMRLPESQKSRSITW